MAPRWLTKRARSGSSRTSTDTTRAWRRCWPRGIRTRTRDRTLPVADAADVDMDEVGFRVVTNSASMKGESGVAQFRSWDARDTDVDGQRLHVETVLGD